MFAEGKVNPSDFDQQPQSNLLDAQAQRQNLAQAGVVAKQAPQKQITIEMEGGLVDITQQLNTQQKRISPKL